MKEQLCIMSDNDDLERYHRLLEDWKPGAPPRRSASRPATGRSPTSTPAPAAFDPEPISQRPREIASPGTILLLNDQNLVVYQRPVPEKEYHLVFSLTRNGAAKL